MAIHHSTCRRKDSVISCAAIAAGIALLLASAVADVRGQPAANYTNNWAVLVCTSRFWFNYRHVANTLSIYHVLKAGGIPDSQIILMLADDMPCNARNSHVGEVYNDPAQDLNIYGQDVEVDYRGREVTVEAFMNVLTGRHDSSVPANKRLGTTDRSNVLVYLSGHGGDGFLKFQDFEEITAPDFADAFAEMHEKRRYHEVVLMADTCQASTLGEALRSPGVLVFTSSVRGENSWGYLQDYQIGVTVIDHFTYHALEFFRKHMRPRSTVQDLLHHVSHARLQSTPHIRADLFDRAPSRIFLSEFFATTAVVSPLLVSTVEVPIASPAPGEHKAMPVIVPSAVATPSSLWRSYNASMMLAALGALVFLLHMVEATMRRRMLGPVYIPFVKMDGCGNDFVVFDGMEQVACQFTATLTMATARKYPEVCKQLSGPMFNTIAARATGIGADQVVVLDGAKHTKETVAVQMQIFNADGSQVAACGNATRCVALYEWFRRGLDRVPPRPIVETIEPRHLTCTYADAVTVKGVDGVQAEPSSFASCWVEVDMGIAKTDWQSVPLDHDVGNTAAVPVELRQIVAMDSRLTVEQLGIWLRPPGASGPCDTIFMSCCSMGNPHAVILVDSVAEINVLRVGQALQKLPLFPRGVNVSFVAPLPAANTDSSFAYRVRVCERGVGVTKACGTAACAVATAIQRAGLHSGQDDFSVIATFDGGPVAVKWPRRLAVLTSDSEAEPRSCHLVGPAHLQFGGVLAVHALQTTCVWREVPLGAMY